MRPFNDINNKTFSFDRKKIGPPGGHRLPNTTSFSARRWPQSSPTSQNHTCFGRNYQNIKAVAFLLLGLPIAAYWCCHVALLSRDRMSVALDNAVAGATMAHLAAMHSSELAADGSCMRTSETS